jgi:rhamnose transport system permease protein
MMGFRATGDGWAWETMLAVLVIAAVIGASLSSPLYFSIDQISYSLQDAIAVVGLIAIGLTVVVIVGEIDISLPATLALGNILFARMSLAEVPLILALPLVLAVCSAAGALNGFLVVRFGLPSLAVTLGAMGAYRALALLLGGQEGYAGFQDSYVRLGSDLIGGVIPASLILLIAVTLLVALVAHKTVLGRMFYAVGNNLRAAHLSGIRTSAVKIAAFAIAGAITGLASLVYIGQYQSARADNASEMLLFVVTAVVLGGVDIFGGRGRVVGVLLALLLLGTIKNAMGLSNVPGSVQTLVIGSVLIAAVLASRLGNLWPAHAPGKAAIPTGAQLNKPQGGLE